MRSVLHRFQVQYEFTVIGLGKFRMSKEEGNVTSVGNLILKALKLERVRHLIYNFVGRRLIIGCGGLAIISTLVADGPMDWPKAVLCPEVSFVSVGTGLPISIEDRDGSKEAAK